MRRDGLANHANHSVDQRTAEEAMKRAGTPKPKLCECEDRPWLEYDEDGHLWCSKCARHRR